MDYEQMWKRLKKKLKKADYDLTAEDILKMMKKIEKKASSNEESNSKSK